MVPLAPESPWILSLPPPVPCPRGCCRPIQTAHSSVGSSDSAFQEDHLAAESIVVMFSKLSCKGV